MPIIRRADKRVNGSKFEKLPRGDVLPKPGVEVEAVGEKLEGWPKSLVGLERGAGLLMRDWSQSPINRTASVGIGIRSCRSDSFSGFVKAGALAESPAGEATTVVRPVQQMLRPHAARPVAFVS